MTKRTRRLLAAAIALAALAATATILLAERNSNSRLERIPTGRAQVGDFLFVDNDNRAYVVHRHDFHLVDDTSKCIGIVFSTETSYADRKAGYTGGYAMALRNAGNDLQFGHASGSPRMRGVQRYFRDYREGLRDTRAMLDGDSPAARAANGYNHGSHPANTSAWFLPSSGQWYDIITNLGKVRTKAVFESGTLSWAERSSYVAQNINVLLAKAGRYAEAFPTGEATFQSSTTMNDGFAFVAYFTGSGGIYLIGNNTDSRNSVRPIIAF